jgi:dTDP-glucose pyrophosphorylase
VTTFLILAGGASTRFEGDKLLERFGEYTLPQYAAMFALHNNATRICVTLSERQIYTDGRNIKHRLLDDLNEVCSPEIALQPPDRYGAGAAVALWQQRITEPTVILFGDNYYAGHLPNMPLPHALYYSTITRADASAANLDLAAVVDGVVIEKPHTVTRGRYFAGFIKMPAESWDVMPTLRASSRKEIEITGIINNARRKRAVDLSNTDMIWDAVTYASDVARIQALIEP